MVKLNLRWGNQANATDPLLEAPGSLVAAAFLLAYLVAWWPYMAKQTAVATMLLVLLSLPCLLWRRVRPGPRSRGPASDSHAGATP